MLFGSLLQQQQQQQRQPVPQMESAFTRLSLNDPKQQNGFITLDHAPLPGTAPTLPLSIGASSFIPMQQQPSAGGEICFFQEQSPMRHLCKPTGSGAPGIFAPHPVSASSSLPADLIRSSGIPIFCGATATSGALETDQMQGFSGGVTPPHRHHSSSNSTTPVGSLSSSLASRSTPHSSHVRRRGVVTRKHRDADGNTPLIQAVISSSETSRDTIDDLIRYAGCMIDEQNYSGQTALHAAILGRKIGLAEHLLSLGADPNMRTLDGATALHAAAAVDSGDLVPALVERGGFVNAADEEGDTPLHWAAREGARDAIARLLEHGADASIQNEDGETAIDIDPPLFSRFRQVQQRSSNYATIPTASRCMPPRN